MNEVDRKQLTKLESIKYDPTRDGLEVNGFFFTKECILANQWIQDLVIQNPTGLHALKEWIAYEEDRRRRIEITGRFASPNKAVVYKTDKEWREWQYPILYDENDLVPNPKS